MRLLIIDNDIEFRRRFSGYIASGCSDISITVAGSEAEADMLQGADHIICDEGTDESIMTEIVEAGLRCTVLRGNEKPENEKLAERIDSVFKFQSAAGIIRGIPEICEMAALAGIMPDLRGSMSVICVSGMTGGSGRTSLSIVLARMLRRRRGEGILIISTSQMSDLYNYFTDTAASGNADINLLLLNYASGSRVNSSAYLLSDEYGISCIRPPSDGISDLPSLTAGELEGFIEYLREWNIFGAVIFDMNGNFDDVSRYLYENSDTVYLIHDDRRCPFGEEEVWKKKVEALTGRGKIKNILNFDISGGEVNRIFFDEDALKTEKMYDFCLPADPDSFYIKNGRADISMSGAFSAAAEKIYRETCMQ